MVFVFILLVIIYTLRFLSVSNHRFGFDILGISIFGLRHYFIRDSDQLAFIFIDLGMIQLAMSSPLLLSGEQAGLTM